MKESGLNEQSPTAEIFSSPLLREGEQDWSSALKKKKTCTLKAVG